MTVGFRPWCYDRRWPLRVTGYLLTPSSREEVIHSRSAILYRLVICSIRLSGRAHLSLDRSCCPLFPYITEDRCDDSK